MLWTTWRNIAVTTLMLLALSAGVVSARDTIESKKIDYLISSLEKLAGAKFIRNGSEYDGKEAASHLRMKLKRAAGRVQTADDFIKICASKSYLSGKPYTIKFTEGKTMQSEHYFRAQLKRYDATVK